MSRLAAVAAAIAAYEPGQEVGLVMDERDGNGRLIPGLCIRPPDAGYVFPCRTIDKDTFTRVADEFGIGVALEILREAESVLKDLLAAEGVTQPQIEEAGKAEAMLV